MATKVGPSIQSMVDELKQLKTFHKKIRSKHLEFLTFLLGAERNYKKKNLERSLSVHKEPVDGVNLINRNQESVLEPRVTLNPEFLAFTFSLEGCPRKLLNYILFYEMDVRTGTFRFNAHVIDRFKDFCDLFGQCYQNGVVKQGMQALVERNIAVNIQRGLYIINPLVAGGKKLDDRKRLVNEYSNLLREKGCDPVIDFFPRYKS
jgi:hypothetical protein